MTLWFLSPQMAAIARDVGLLDLLSEFIDANADTVCLITGDRRTGLEWLAYCDYLRALQRLGHETLARHDQRVRGSRPGGEGAARRFGPCGCSSVGRSLSWGWHVSASTQPQTTTPLNARVAERCGFTREEVLSADATHDWRPVELVAFSLLARDLP